jgi:hypothetical protein
MRNAIRTCIFLLATSISCFGQLLTSATADVNDPGGVLKSAKKVAVLIEVGPPAAAYYIPDFPRAKKQMSQKLARVKLIVVTDPIDADVVIVVHEQNEGANNVTICLGDKLDVFKGGKAPAESDIPLFSVNEYCGVTWPLNRAMDKLIKAMKDK